MASYTLYLHRNDFKNLFDKLFQMEKVFIGKFHKNNEKAFIPSQLERMENRLNISI